MTSNPGTPGIRGIWPALMTPLHEDLSIDHARFAAHARQLIADGCGGVTPFGTTGEGPSFSLDERRAAVDALVAGGVPAARILVSTSCAALPEAIALTRHAQDLGAWGVLLMPPFFFKGVPDAGIVAAYRAVLDATAERALRVVLYHIPQVAGVGLSQAVIAELLQRYPGRIVAIKDSAGDRAHSVALAQAFMAPGQPRIGVHVGHEPDLPTLGRLGSGGAVSGLANFMPRAVHRLVAEPDSAAAARDLGRIERLLGLLGGYALIPALKAIQAVQTGDMAWRRVRPPLVALDDARTQALAAAIAELGLDRAQD
ncbi:MAG TPA: dihydrodipicolinate synthase family protein [Burkholderiaceae bacterium]|nr:dihydrodipicolinate synthase family protein [Burkholderiaceae bacterium]